MAGKTLNERAGGYIRADNCLTSTELKAPVMGLWMLSPLPAP